MKLKKILLEYDNKIAKYSSDLGDYIKILKPRINGWKFDVEYMSVEEAEDYYWDSRPVCIVLDNGTRLILQADDEGNDGGALWYGTGKEQDVLPVLGLRD